MPSAKNANFLENATLAILAGGAGSRMGRPKGLLTLGEQPILDYLLDHLQWPGPTLLVTAPDREHPPGHTRFTREVSDPIPGQGPLRGILTALEHLGTPLLIALTIDMPGVRSSHCAWMLDALRRDPPAFGFMPRRNLPDGPRIEPFPFALRLDAMPTIRRRLLEGKRAVHGLLDEPTFMAIDSPADWPDRVWINLNVPDDLRRFAP